MSHVKDHWHLATKTIHGYGEGDKLAGAISLPIYQTSTYHFNDAQHGADLFAGKVEGHVYSRISNPTVDAFQREIACLEGAEAAQAFGSGMGAIFNAIMAICESGDSYISSKTVYGGTHGLNDHVIGRFGVTCHEVDFSDLNVVEDAIKNAKNPKILYFETPANPTLEIYDIRDLVELGHKHNLTVIMDNTFATPMLQHPLSLGVDVVLHSATKYICGHGDVVAGVVAGSADYIKKLRDDCYIDTGATMAPFNAWLLIRGLKTLSVRVRQHCENAKIVAEYLAKHPKVTAMHYPGLASNPGHEIAKKQMEGFGGMMAFEIAGGFEEGKKVMDAIEMAQVAVSLGDCDTLIVHPASTTHATYSTEQRMNAGIKDNLIRLSVGIENVNDIIEDLEIALKAI